MLTLASAGVMGYICACIAREFSQMQQNVLSTNLYAHIDIVVRGVQRNFSTPKLLLKHCKDEHPKVQCHICKSFYERKNDLGKHMAKAHKS